MNDWFRHAQFGLFVHWDHASAQGLELSWPLVGGLFALPKCQAVSVADYHLRGDVRPGRVRPARGGRARP